MFRRDPIAIVFGRDIAHLINRIIHQEALKEVNAEYYSRWEYSIGHLANWRNLHNKWSYSRQIHNFDTSKRNVILLPKNY